MTFPVRTTNPRVPFRLDAWPRSKQPEPETELTAEAFAGVACYCRFCKLELIAPWVPASCPRCRALMRVGETV